MPVENLQEFETSLDRFGDELPKVVLQAQKAAIQDAAEVIERATPERTGRAKASVQTGYTPRDTGRNIRPLSTARPFGVVHAFSDLFYFRFLNDGTKKMRGRHMIQRGAIKAFDVLRRELS